MVNKNLWILLVALFCLKNVHAQEKTNFDWLIGNWKIEREKNTRIETWYKKNDSVYIGFSGFVVGKDTIPEESVELKKVKNSWYYIPTTLNQNNGNPIPFKLIFLGDKEFISENKKHDFPTRINYRFIHNNLYASIEGNFNNKFKKVNFDFIKIN